MKRLTAACAVLLVAVAFSACEKKEPAKPEAPPPPPPPTADELSQQVIQTITPQIAAGSAGAPQLVNTLNTEFSKLRGEINGEKAMMQVRNWLKQMLSGAMENENWDGALALCDAIDAVEPGNSRTARSRERALAERNRPRVKVNGFFEDRENETTTVFMDVYLPETNTMENVKVREGEEFLGLQLEQILGDNSAVRIKYLKTQETFDVKVP